MNPNGYYQNLQSCLALVSQSLADEESILLVEQGQTRYGRQTFSFYKVRIGTFEGMTGNKPVNLRTVVVQVNVDPPNVAQYASESDWHPLES